MREPKIVRGSFSPQRSALLLVMTLFIAGCSGETGGDPEETAPPPSPPETEASVERIDDENSESVSSPSTSASSTPDDTIRSESSSSPVSWEQLVAPTCEALSTAGYETRSQRYDEFLLAAEDSAAAAQGLVDVCGEDLERLREAQRIEAAALELAADQDPVSISSVRCADGTYSFIAENTAAAPLGIHIAFRIFEGDDTEPRSSADYPIVIWELGPGERQGITGEFEEPSTSDYRCNLSARVFVADTSSAGAGVPGMGREDRQGDRPTEWIGALLEDETLAIGSGDIDAAASTEDLRSLFYDDVVAAVMSDATTTRVPVAVTICEAAVDQPDPDRMSVVYHITYRENDTEESFLRHGLFRRGADGMWRWLSAAQYFQSNDFASCASS